MKQRLILAGGAICFLLIAGSVLGDTSLAVNVQSFLMVLGGTVVGVLLAFPLPTFRDLMHSIKTLFRQDASDFSATVQQIAALARIRRTSGPRELNEAGNQAANPFLRKGIDLVADGYDRHEIHFIMEKEYELYFSSKESQINILNTMAKVAPAFGFLGTVIGLINLLHNISDSSLIAKGMSLALLTTLYGLLFTNFLFLPLARKLSEHVKAEAAHLNIILEGILGIAESKNPIALSHRLESYLASNLPLQRRPVYATMPEGVRRSFLETRLQEMSHDIPVGQ